MGRGTALLIAAVVAAGCGVLAPRPPAPRQSEALQRSARMLQELDRLEADLDAGNAETQLYADLVERHGHAQQIACKVTEDHVREIHRLALAQEQKIEQRRLARRHHHKMAMARAPAGAVASR